MSIKCPSGTSLGYRYKKGSSVRFGGCMKKGKFINKGIKEVKIKNTIKNI